LFGENGEVAGGIAIVRDVTERKQLEGSKERFIADAAHELRTPIGIVHGFATLLASGRDDLSSRIAREAIESIGTQSERMRALVNDLLDLSRLEQAGVQLEMRPVTIAEIVDASLSLAPPPHGTVVDRDVDGGARVVADPGRLHQVLINLLTNAYKYGGHHVEVVARHRAAIVEIIVCDDGDGVPADLVDRLFEPFSRGQNSIQIGGSGLGLAIVRSIIEGCGGVVAYEDSSSGARFHITLPAA
jgi:signal transduction histidine kinase